MAAIPDRPVTVVERVPAADPAPLDLAGFALTTFLLSGHNASFIPDLIWVGFAMFYGGMAQFCAGMWEFRNRRARGDRDPPRDRLLEPFTRREYVPPPRRRLLGVVTAGLVWYTSAAGVIAGVFGWTMVPVGKPLVPARRASMA